MIGMVKYGMIGYITLGTNDIQKAAAFYDALLGVIGGERYFDSDDFVAWGQGPEMPCLAIAPPQDGNPATSGNGTMTALKVDKPESVDIVFRTAIALGAEIEGQPSQEDESFYGGYFRDLDGHLLAIFCPTEIKSL